MLLVIDVGNTNIVIGIFQEDSLTHHWRISTRRNLTIDETALLIHNLFHLHDLEKEKVEGCIISSVVPPLHIPLEGMCDRLFHIKPIFVGPGIKTGISILYENPKEVGADRIVNAVAAYHKHRQAIIVVDFGTATTLDCISEKGEYLGGIIAPGVTISAEALFQFASKLPKVEIAKPPEIIGRNTVNSIQSGLYYGYISMVDGLVEKLIMSYQWHPIVIATGGLAKIVAPDSKYIAEVDEFLTLNGLKIIYELNRSRRTGRKGDGRKKEKTYR